MILDIYKNSIKYSLEDSRTLLYFSLTIFANFIVWMAYFIGFFNLENIELTLISLAIAVILTLIIEFIFLGYEYKVLENSAHDTINETYEVPKFYNIKEMIKNGAKIFAVKFIYLIIPVIIVAITNIEYINNVSGGVIGTIGATISILLAIILYFVSFISVTHMAVHNNFKKAFDFEEIKEIISKIGTARYVLFYIGLLIIAGIIIYVLFSIIMGISIITVILSIGSLWWGVVIVANLLMSFVIALVELFKTRGIALIYEPIE